MTGKFCASGGDCRRSLVLQLGFRHRSRLAAWQGLLGSFTSNLESKHHTKSFNHEEPLGDIVLWQELQQQLITHGAMRLTPHFPAKHSMRYKMCNFHCYIDLVKRAQSKIPRYPE
jgi:hypothetical protein